MTFWKIIQDKNILLLDFDYFEGKQYTETQKNEIEKLWFRLYDEYFVLLDDMKMKSEINKSFSELKIRDKITQITHNYTFLQDLIRFRGLISDEQIKEYEQQTYKRLLLIEPRIKIKYFEGIESNLEMLDRVIKSLVNQYNIEHKENTKKINQEVKNVYEMVANAESWLERNLNINDMVVAHWIAIKKQIDQKQKAQQKNKWNGK